MGVARQHCLTVLFPETSLHSAVRMGGEGGTGRQVSARVLTSEQARQVDGPVLGCRVSGHPPLCSQGLSALCSPRTHCRPRFLPGATRSPGRAEAPHPASWAGTPSEQTSRRPTAVQCLILNPRVPAVSGGLLPSDPAPTCQSPSPEPLQGQRALMVTSTLCSLVSPQPLTSLLL